MSMAHRNYYAILLVLGLFACVFVFYSYRSIPARLRLFLGTHSGPRIVVWAKQYHKIDWTFPELKNGDGGCDISFHREDVPYADAVVFFMKSCHEGDLPDAKTRRSNQVYVWWSHESPWTVRNYYAKPLTEFNNYFNWTMTYRGDSDVLAAMWPTPAMDYLLQRLGRESEMVDKYVGKNNTMANDQFQREVKHLMSLKEKFIAWIVSDCDVTTGAKERRKYVESLKAKGTLEIDEYGNCVGNPLPFLFPKVFKTLASYKFYFAFENSYHCRDYLTEKTLFNCFVSGTVPVIHGPERKDVEKLIPKGSFIFAEDFSTVEELGSYLQLLDKNDTAYMEYFNWWRDPGALTYPRYGFNLGPKYLTGASASPQFTYKDLQEDWLEYERFGMYHLCRKLKRGDHYKSKNVISDLSEWWYGKENKACLGD